MLTFSGKSYERGCRVARTWSVVSVAVLAGILFLLVLMLRAAYAQDGANFGNTCDVAFHGDEDPIFGPDHQHVFYGATEVRNSDEGSDLRGRPTSCNRKDNSSAYWHPEVYRNGSHTPLAVDTTKGLGDNTIYYRAGDLDPKAVRPFPADFEMVARDNGAPGEVKWGCEGSAAGQADEPPNSCNGPDPLLQMTVKFPNCWDGVQRSPRPEQLDMSSRGKCPEGYPRELPTISFSVNFVLPDSGAVGDITVSGHDADHQTPAGTMHADFVNGWAMQEKTIDGRVWPGLNTLVEQCINQEDSTSTTETKPRICIDPGNRPQ